MVANSWLSAVLSQAWSLPYLVVYLVGILLALLFWGRHPGVSALALGGFVVLLVNILASCAWQAWLVSGTGRGGIGDLGRWLQAIAVLQGLVSAFGHALLMAAIFGWRTPNARKA
jgi:hypothetical protein